jgi:hypothetical protein
MNASKREVVEHRFAAVLPCNNVIDLKWRHVKCSAQVTIFTASTSSLPNFAGEIGVQYD